MDQTLQAQYFFKLSEDFLELSKNRNTFRKQFRFKLNQNQKGCHQFANHQIQYTVIHILIDDFETFGICISADTR